MPQSTMPQIKKIVFLMLENRSLDNVLGWLYRDSAPAHVWPYGSSAAYDGLRAGMTQPYRTVSGHIVRYPVTPVPGGLGSDADAVPYWDPTEEMYAETTWNGVLNQLFGDYRMIQGMPTSGVPGMQGFYQDYYNYEMVDWKGMDILWTYTPDQLPILNTLAKGYAVSDAWFCSVPTQTNPNRAYSIIGTSQGQNNNTWNAVQQFPAPTVFNALGNAGKSWGLYYHHTWQEGLCYTEYTFPGLSGSGGDIATLDKFYSLAQSGNLPDFTYLEPKWGYGLYGPYVQGWDYHPPTHCVPGETFLLQVFAALATSPHWNETLFVVTFDEHGGTFDHVAPPWGAINPDNMNGDYGFGFNLFGARVPALLISPFIRKSTVFRAPAGSRYPFDHTSWIKTFLQWAGVDTNDPSLGLGNRMPAAPTFEGVLSPTIVNEETPELTLPTIETRAPETMPGTDLPVPISRGEPLDDLFEGVSFASVRAILHDNRSLAGIMEGVERYRADPQAFEADLKAQN